MTGAAGFIGSHLVDALLTDGHEIVGIDSLSDSYDAGRKRDNLARALDDECFSFVAGDLCDLPLNRLLDGANVVFHLAGRPGARGGWGRDFPAYLHENVLSTQRLLDAARHARPQRIVLASSSSVYGRATRFPIRETDPPSPVTPYGTTKLAAEQLCAGYSAEHGVDVVVLRYFTVYGPRQRPDMAFARFISAALGGRRLPVYGDGHQRRDFTYVADAVRATVAARSRGVPGRTYNVAGGCTASLMEVVAELEQRFGPLPVEHRPATAGDPHSTQADIQLAVMDLGYQPRTRLEEGLDAQLSATRAIETAAIA